MAGQGFIVARRDTIGLDAKRYAKNCPALKRRSTNDSESLAYGCEYGISRSGWPRQRDRSPPYIILGTCAPSTSSRQLRVQMTRYAGNVRRSKYGSRILCQKMKQQIIESIKCDNKQTCRTPVLGSQSSHPSTSTVTPSCISMRLSSKMHAREPSAAPPSHSPDP